MLVNGPGSPFFSTGFYSTAAAGLSAAPGPAAPGPGPNPGRSRDPLDHAAAERKIRLEKQLGLKECQTCRERKYQDKSDDSGVSMKAPTHLAPGQAAGAVRAHENEHVNREQAQARRENREVVSQSVQIHTSVCPECGRTYVSGGTTTTTTRGKPEPASPPPDQPGQRIDQFA